MTDKTVSVDRKFGHMVRTATQSHIEVKCHYGPEDVKDISYEVDRHYLRFWGQASGQFGEADFMVVNPPGFPIPLSVSKS